MPKITNWSRQQRVEDNQQPYVWKNDEKDVIAKILDRGETYEAMAKVVETGQSLYSRQFKSREDARQELVDWMKKNPMANRDDVSESGSIPEDVQVTFTLGSPVKAFKYYSSEHGGFVRHNDDRPLYVQGDSKPGSSDVRYTSDVKDVQAYGSTVMFIYSDEGELEWEELKDIVDEAGLISTETRMQEIYLYRGGERIPALKTSTENGRKGILGNLVRRFDERTSYEPQFTPDQAEDSGTFWIFT